MKSLFLAITFILPAVTFGQITVAPAGGPAQIGTLLTGNGVTMTNVQIGGDSIAYGVFTAFNTNLGMNGGLVMTTGHINNVVGPNNSTYTGTDNASTASDAQLMAIEPQACCDVCKMTMDCVPSDDTLYFNFVFGSEEYPEFVNASFNDVFGIFISGGIYNNTNIATLPNGTTPVSIDNVNSGTNAAYYYDNTGDTNLQYDGTTVNLLVTIPVVPNMTYTIKIAIADAGDGIYDSGVFLQAGSFRCSGQPLDAPAQTTAPSTVLAYPVPANDQLNFTITSLENPEVNVVIRSLDGKQVLAQQTQSANGNVSVDVSALAAGTYIAEISHDGITESKLVVVNHP